MASATYTSDSDGDDFLGFEQRDADLAAAAYAPLRDRRYSDISLSEPSSDDTDFDDSSSDDEVFAPAPAVHRWSADLANIHLQPFRGPRPGPVATLSAAKNELDFFHLLFPETLLQDILVKTNR